MQSTKVPCNFFTGTAVLVVIRIVNEGPVVLFLDFYVILILYCFDEKAGWWYIKRKGVPDSVGRLHYFAIKPS